MAWVDKFFWQKQLRGHDLTGNERAVLETVSTYANGETGCGAYPSLDTLASDTCLDRRTVMRVLSPLIERGYLVRTARGGHGKGMTSHYDLGDPAKARPRSTPRRSKRAPVPSAEEDNETPRGVTVPPYSHLQEGQPRTPRGALGVSPRGATLPPDQITSSDHSSDHVEHPLPAVSGAAGAAPTDFDKWHPLMADCEATENWLRTELLTKELGGMSTEEYRTVDGMWESGQHPKAILNAILKQRRIDRAFS